MATEHTTPSSAVSTAPCPRCGYATSRIQVASAPVVCFLLVYIVWATERIVGCSRCVQSRLWRLFWISFPLANVFIPVVWPLILIEIRASQRNKLPVVPLELAAAAASPPSSASLSEPVPRPETARERAVRLLIVLGILVVVITVVLLVLPRITQ